MSEMSVERPLPEALVPDVWRREPEDWATTVNRASLETVTRLHAEADEVWRCEPARCTNCGDTWHAGQKGGCETSCLAAIVIHPQPTIPPNVILSDN